MKTLPANFSAVNFQIKPRDPLETRIRTAIDEAISLVQSEMSRTPYFINHKVSVLKKTLCRNR